MWSCERTDDSKVLKNRIFNNELKNSSSPLETYTFRHEAHEDPVHKESNFSYLEFIFQQLLQTHIPSTSGVHHFSLTRSAILLFPTAALLKFNKYQDDARDIWRKEGKELHYLVLRTVQRKQIYSCQGNTQQMFTNLFTLYPTLIC